MWTVLTYFFNSFWDFARGLKHNYNSPLTAEQTRLRYQIIILSHTVEKGLSLREPRVGFGEAKLRRLMEMMKRYDASADPFPVQMARGAINAYVKHHRDAGFNSPLVVEAAAFTAESLAQYPFEDSGGWKSVPAQGEAGPDALGFRFSARDYAKRSIPDATVLRLVTRAARAPSQCNRQSVRVHCYRSREQIDELLRLQGGSAGFVEHVQNLFVISSELAAWGGPGQRNQAYVDGGLFAMCLMLACTEAGLACCPLNLAKTNRQELEIGARAGIPASERLIMMMAFGEPVDGPGKAAASPRLPVEQLLTLHKPNSPEAAAAQRRGGA